MGVDGRSLDFHSWDSPVRVLVSNIGDGTLHLVEVAADGKMKDVGHATVGKAPKRVAIVPVVAP